MIDDTEHTKATAGTANPTPPVNPTVLVKPPLPVIAIGSTMATRGVSDLDS